MRTIKASCKIKVPKYCCDKCKFTHADEEKVIIHYIMAHAKIQALKIEDRLYVYANSESDLKLFVEYVFNDTFINRNYDYNWIEPEWYSVSQYETRCTRGCCFIMETSCNSISFGNEFDAFDTQLSVDNKKFVIKTYEEISSVLC